MLSRYEYACPNGHAVESPRPMVRCPVARCGAELRRVGKGSRPRRTQDGYIEVFAAVWIAAVLVALYVFPHLGVRGVR